jgi:type VI secretion system protein ImpC
MPQKPLNSIVLDVNASDPSEQPEPRPVHPRPDDPFRILVLGDFSGSENRPALSTRRPQRIDRDNFDEILGAMRVQAALRFGPAATVPLNFTALSDFEPDSIFERCDLFHRSAPALRRETRSIPKASAARPASGSLLDEIVEEAEADAGRPTGLVDGLQAIVERVVSPHVVRTSREDRSAQDEAYAERMRAILHHPQFQTLEAAWRALDFLVRGVDKGGAVSLHILDITKDELGRDVDALSSLLTPRDPQAVIAGNYVFDRSAKDAVLLQQLGQLARRSGSAFIAEAAPPDQDAESPEWRALRRSPEARWIGLALPRFLARVPYGSRTYSIETFPFEEVPDAPEHSDFLWANPAFACALLLGRAYNEYGWNFRPGVVRHLEGLPYYPFEAGAEMRSQPCAEVLLTDHEIDFLQEQGIMALAAMKNGAAAMLMRFQSIAEPTAGLAGRWL